MLNKRLGRVLLGVSAILAVGLAAVVPWQANEQIVRVQAGGAPPRGSGALNITGSVRAIDGDTLETWINGSRVGIGVLGISAPAGNSECGRQATAQMWGLVSGGIRAEE